MSIRTLAAAGLVALAGTTALAADRTIIVLDASGSMWGQIKGKAKIEIAREALAKVVGEYDPARELGLMAYGHREKGQCKDIELVVPAAPGTAGAITDAVAGIKPKGKTPLSDAVRMAAESLKYTEDKATVVLITDGLETCNADPCALGRELEGLGVDFTAHVVGFGLSEKEGRQVACLADETGGLYLSAANAEELNDALGETVQAAPPAPVETPPEASLTAPDEAEIASVVDVGWDAPGEKNDRVELYDPNALQGDGKVLRNYPIRYGDLDARTVDVTMPSTPGAYELRYYHAESRKILATRAITVVPVDVALTAPETTPIARNFTVEWIGPGAKNDRIELWDPNARQGEGKKVRDVFLRYGDLDAQTVTMPAAGKPGMYELRYHSGVDRKVLATRAIEITEMTVSMTPEEGAAVGKPVVIDWIGPGARNDRIEMWDPNARGGEGKKLTDMALRNGDLDNQQVTLPGPAKAGMYELRYWNADNRMVLATEPLEVAETLVSLDAPESIEAGRTIRVTWEGPGARYDSVILWDPSAKGGEGKKLHEMRLRNADFDNQQVTLPGPAKAGTYELRYWNGDNRTVLATREIVVTEAVVSLDAPDSIEAGRPIRVTWEGPGARYDSVILWDPSAKGGEGKKLHEMRLRNADFDNQKATLPGPAEAGTYELRYWNGDNRTVMATRQIVVTEAVVSIEARDAVGQGFVVKVKWEGPGARYDSIELWDPNAKGGEGKKLFEARLRNGDFENQQVTLPGPVKVGTYELRYWNGDNRKVMATRPLEVTPIELAIEGPEAVEVGTTFGVTWKGPGARYDDVQIYDPKTDKVVAGRRLRNDQGYDDNKASIKAPKQPGEYLLRYWNGDNRAVLTEQPISVQ